MPHSSHRRYQCVVECDPGPDWVIFAKKAPRSEYQNMTRLYEANDPRIRAVVPRPLGYVADIQYLLLEHVEGRTMMNFLVMDCLGLGALTRDAGLDCLRESAVALARLQNALPSEATVYYSDRRLAELEIELEETGYFATADLDRLRLELTRLRPTIARIPAILSHGEFGPRNIIVQDGGELALIDWPHFAVHNLYYDAHMFLNSLLGLARVFPWARRRLDKMATEFRQAYSTECDLVPDPGAFEDAGLVNRLELLLRSHRRLRNARNRRVLRRAESFIQFQKGRILRAVSDGTPGF
jgi:hypothetical protein